MKIKLSFIFKIAVVCCTIIELRYLLIFSENEIVGNFTVNLFVALISIILCICTIGLSGKNIRLKRYYKILWNYIIPYVCAVGISLIYTWGLYNYSFKSVLITITPYLYIFLAFPLIYIFYYDKSCIYFLRTIATLEIVILFIKAVGWYSYNFLHKSLFQSLILEFGQWTREGIQRAEAGQLYGLTLIIVTYLGFNNKKEKKYFFSMIGLILFMAIITRFRFQLAVSLVTIIIIYYFMKNNKKRKLWVKFILSIIAIAVLSSGIIFQILDNASVFGKYGSSTIVRLQTIDYFFELMKERNSYFGLGLLDSSNPAAYRLLYKDKWEDYYLDDLGILDPVICMGILMIVVYVWLFILTCKVCYKCWKYKNYSWLALLFGVSFYMICSCLMLNIYDKQRAFGVPFYLAIISYINMKIEDEKMGELEINNFI